MSDEHIKVPEGFRLLTKGETVKKGDRYTRNNGESWHETHHPGGKWNRDGYWPMIRKQ